MVKEQRDIFIDLLYTCIHTYTCIHIHTDIKKNQKILQSGQYYANEDDKCGWNENISWNPNISMTQKKRKLWLILYVSEYTLMTRDPTFYPLTRMWVPGQQNLTFLLAMNSQALHHQDSWINAGGYTQAYNEEPEVTSDEDSSSYNIQKMHGLLLLLSVLISINPMTMNYILGQH